MRTFFSTVKRIILWSYERGTWQYDVLCILILAFVFLTPSDCFRRPPAPDHQVVGSLPGKRVAPANEQTPAQGLDAKEGEGAENQE